MRLVSGQRLESLRSIAVWAGLLSLSIVYRLPVLMHARGLNSDVAIVGLQARHILRGEFAPFLWGSSYQSSADSFYAAAWFLLLDATPFALVFSSLSLHLLLTTLVYVSLAKVLSLAQRFFVCLLLVFASPSVHSYALNPPREASLLLAFSALFVLLPDPKARFHRGRLFIGLSLAGLSICADPYARLMYPACIFVAFVYASSSELRLVSRLFLIVLFAALGLVPDVFLRLSDSARSGPMGFDLGLWQHNRDLLLSVCAPWALGAQSYAAGAVMNFEQVHFTAGVSLLQGAGFIAYCILLLLSVVSLVRAGRVERVFGLAGLLTIALTLSGFLVSVMVMDLFAMRYLATLTLMAPFAIVPAVKHLPKRLALSLVALHASGTAISGWTAFRPYVDGLHLVRDPVGARPFEDGTLLGILQGQGVVHAMADYWACYRLGFLAEERVVFVPKNASEDRYPPFRAAFENASRVAYVHDHNRSRESLVEARQSARALGRLFQPETQVGPYTVFWIERLSP
jgi:hypothetical protein